MSEAEQEQAKAKAIAESTARLQSLLYETRRDEARFKQFLEMRRLRRRLLAQKGK